MNKLPIVILMGLALMGVSCKETTKGMKGDVVVQESHSSENTKEKKYVLNKNSISFEDKKVMPKVFDAYQMITEDLVNSDFKTAQRHVADLLQAVGDSKEEKWSRVEEVANKLADVNNLETFRVGFFDLTRVLETPFKEGISGGNIYMQYCPMAFNNKGAYWFSSDKEIMNPYFGDEMLNCGGVKEIFKSE